MAKMKLEEEADNMQWTAETKTVWIESHEFLKKIEGKEKIHFPKFNLGRIKFHIIVDPHYVFESGSGFINFCLHNDSLDTQITSYSVEGFNVKKGTGDVKIEIPPGGCKGEVFMSHVHYRKLAKKNDEFKIKATVTLHTKESPTEDSFARYLFGCLNVKRLIYLQITD